MFRSPVVSLKAASRTEQLLARLVDLDDRYREWGPDDLAALLRPLGVRAAQIWREGRNRNGYDRDEITTTWRHGQAGGDR